VQKGGDTDELAAKKKEMEAKRSANATRGVKTFYKVTVTVRFPFSPQVWLFAACEHAICWYLVRDVLVMVLWA